MNNQIVSLIDSVKEKSLKNQELTKDELVALLDIDPDSEECDYLGRAAMEVKFNNTNNYVRIGTSIGIDLKPCTMSCKFCSLGEKWNLIQGEYELSDETILTLVGDLLKRGFYQYTLRTTEFYSIERLAELCRKIRATYGDKFWLTANTGELTVESAKILKDAGFNGIYHAVRLREGIDTPLSVETRVNTIKSAQAVGLHVSSGIDPIGIEHTSEEIADRLLLFRELKLNGVCTMRRVNVPGTPMEGVEMISDRRLAQVVAVNRLAGGGRWMVACHPALQIGLEWGADNIAVETGANPRNNNTSALTWSIIDHSEALKVVERAKCRVHTPEEIFGNVTLK